MRTFGKDWKKTSEFIGTRTSHQVRNYAFHYKDKLTKSTKQDNNDLLEILNESCECYWLIEEKNKFDEGLKLHGRNWKMIQEHIGSKNKG